MAAEAREPTTPSDTARAVQRKDVRVLHGATAIARCAELVAAAAQPAARLCVTGGRGAARVYDALAAGGADLAGAELWLSDERCVPPGDERSNARLVQARLVEPLPAAQRPTLRPIPVECGPEGAAAVYERELALAGGDARRPPRFALVLLSVGEDGHVASLFPARPELGERARWVVPVPEPGLPPLVPRVTLAVPTLAATETLVLLALGPEKRPALESLLSSFGGGSASIAGSDGGAAAGAGSRLQASAAPVTGQTLPALLLAQVCRQRGVPVTVVTDLDLRSAGAPES